MFLYFLYIEKYNIYKVKLLKTHWEYLMIANYEVDHKILEPFIPNGCELNLHEGRALLSVVAFRFSKTQLCGLPMPLYRVFSEINLRFYVKRKAGDFWRR